MRSSFTHLCKQNKRVQTLGGSDLLHDDIITMT